MHSYIDNVVNSVIIQGASPPHKNNAFIQTSHSCKMLRATHLAAKLQVSIHCNNCDAEVFGLFLPDGTESHF